MGPRCFGKACVKDDPLYDLSLLLSIALRVPSYRVGIFNHCGYPVFTLPGECDTYKPFFYDSSFSLNNVALMTDKLVNDLHLSKIDVIF
jgi:hypothetical protein